MVLYILLLITTSAAAMLVCRANGQPGTRGQLINRMALVGIFMMLFLVSALRYETGNDYPRYEEIFRRIWGGWVVPTEWGFNVLIKGLGYLFGETNYLLFFALFAFFTVFFMLKALYALSESFGFSFFLFMAFGYYFNSMNTMRYYFAAALALYAIVFIQRKQYVRFVCVILLAALIHKSVLLVMPIYLLANIPWKPWAIAVISALGISGLFLGNFYLKLILILYPSYQNTEYLEGGTSYANILRCGAVIAFCLFFRKNGWWEKKDLRMYFRLSCGALLLYLCGSFIPEVSRIGTYMTIPQVFLLPGVAMRVGIGGDANGTNTPEAPSEGHSAPAVWYKNPRIYAMLGVCAAAIFYFVLWLYKADGDVIKLLPYKSFLFEGL